MSQLEKSTLAKWPMVARLSRGDTPWLIGLSAVLLLTLLPFSSYIVSLPFIRAEWQMTNTQAAMVFSSYLLGNAISALVLVPLTDRLSPGRVLTAGAIVLTIGNLLFPLLAWNFWAGSLLRFMAGAGHVAVYIPGVQLVSQRYAGGKRGMAVGIFVSAGYAGTTISYTFMGLLLNVAPSWRIAYFITALVGLAGLVLLYPLMREKRGATHQIGVATTASPPGEANRRRGRLNLGVLRDRAIALVIVAYTLHTAELYIVRLWFPSLLGETLTQAGMASVEATSLAATLSGFMFMMGIAGVFAGGFISDYLGRSRGAALIFTVSGLCSWVAGWLLGAPPLLLISLGFLYGFATAADSAIYSTAITELAPPDRIGSTQAVQTFIGFAVGAAMPVVAGSILDLAQSASGWGLAFTFNGVLAIIGVASLVWLRVLPQATQMAAGKR